MNYSRLIRSRVDAIAAGIGADVTRKRELRALRDRVAVRKAAEAQAYKESETLAGQVFPPDDFVAYRAPASMARPINAIAQMYFGCDENGEPLRRPA